MKVKFYFRDWVRSTKSICQKQQVSVLQMGSLHSGTVLNGSITLDEYDEALLKEALKEKIYPVFEIIEEGD
jgi:hypothetical protein